MTKALVPTIVEAVKAASGTIPTPSDISTRPENQPRTDHLQTVPSIALGMPQHTPRLPFDEGPSDSPRDLFHSRAIPLVLHVPDEMRAKIASHKYIDLDCLLPNQSISHLAPDSGTFHVVDGVLRVSETDQIY